MSELITPILDNLFGYDMIIIIMAIGTLGYFLFVLWHADRVYSSIFTQGYSPDDVFDESEKVTLTKADVKAQKNKLRRMRETSEKYYTMFTNLTSIFPLMGILGTVVALIPLVEQLDAMEQSFFVALTSTLWGLVFAISFKLLDGILSPKIDRNDRGIEDYLERLELKFQEMTAAKPIANATNTTTSSVHDEVVMVESSS